jgi:DNA invertase Pin-like site-specific DNA recombinase
MVFVTFRQTVVSECNGARMPRHRAARLYSAPGQPRFVSYIRVSTAQQGASGLGLEAQREAVVRHVRTAQGVLVAEFTEVESGKKNDRPEIAAALAACRLRHASLVIAKLDRLARNVFFISSLMESGVDFVACDNPHATRLTIHILAAVAEHEREMISQRTIAALAAAKARGVRLGNPNLRPGDRRATRHANQVRRALADRHTRDVMVYIEAARAAGCSSLGELARALTARGIATPAGLREDWHPYQVKRILARGALLRQAAD